MQLTGGRFASETALLGNDLSTLPDFPAEIRARRLAARRLGLPDPLRPRHPHAGRCARRARGHEPGGAQDQRERAPEGRHHHRQHGRVQRAESQKAGYAANPLEDGSLDEFRVQPAAHVADDRGAEGVRRLQARGGALEEHVRARARRGSTAGRRRARSPSSRRSSRAAPTSRRRTSRPSRPATPSARRPRSSPSSTRRPAQLAPGTYRNVTGNQALAMGLIAASVQSKLPLFLGAYPITPASGILEEPRAAQDLRRADLPGRGRDRRRRRGARRILRRRARRLHLERPGRRPQGGDDRPRGHARAPARHSRHPAAGPPTGMPTKPEQADLLMVLFGRNAESPVPVIAASTPATASPRRSRPRGSRSSTGRPCTSSRTPTSPTAPSRGSCRTSPHCPTSRRRSPSSRTTATASSRTFATTTRWPASGRCRHARPRAPDRRAREGGAHRQHLLRARQPRPDGAAPARKVAGIAGDIPRLEVDKQPGARLLVLGWGGTYGSIAAAAPVRARGGAVDHAHLTYLNPFPRNLGEVLRLYDRVLVPEMNLGQLLKLVRAEFLVDAVGYNRARRPVHLGRAGRHPPPT